jgi:transcriptional regulator with XRE-family HTH domain
MNTIKDRLAEAMTERDVSASDLASHCGVSTVAVHKWLTGKTKQLKYDTCIKAAYLLKVSPDWLNFGKGPKRLNDIGRRIASDDERRAALRRLEAIGEMFTEELRRLREMDGPAQDELPVRRKAKRG